MRIAKNVNRMTKPDAVTFENRKVSKLGDGMTIVGIGLIILGRSLQYATQSCFYSTDKETQDGFNTLYAFFANAAMGGRS